MPFGRDKHTIGILRVDDDRRNLLRIAEPNVRPGLPCVRRFVNTVANGKIGTLQSFPASHVNNVGIGWSNSQRAHRARGLVIKDRVPHIAEIAGLPHTSIHRRHIENTRLVRHSCDRNGAASAERSDASPAHLGKQLRVVLLSGKRERSDRQKNRQQPSLALKKRHAASSKTSEHNAVSGRRANPVATTGGFRYCWEILPVSLKTGIPLRESIPHEPRIKTCRTNRRRDVRRRNDAVPPVRHTEVLARLSLSRSLVHSRAYLFWLF